MSTETTEPETVTAPREAEISIFIDPEIKQLNNFHKMNRHPFMYVDTAMDSILGSGVNLTLEQEEYMRTLLARLQKDGYNLGHGVAMGWI